MREGQKPASSGRGCRQPARLAQGQAPLIGAWLDDRRGKAAKSPLLGGQSAKLLSLKRRRVPHCSAALSERRRAAKRVPPFGNGTKLRSKRFIGAREALLAGLFQALGWLPQAAGRLLAKLAAKALDWLGTDAARVTRINLARCFPDLGEAELQALARSSLEHTASLLFESGPLARWPARRLARLNVSETGREAIAEALNDGRGALMFVPHFGNWEFLCFTLGAFGFVSLYDPPRIQALDAILRRKRERFGARLVPASPSGLRTLCKALQRGGLVCLLPDQVPHRRGGEFAPFFGQPALTMTLPHRLLRRTRPLVLLGSARRVRNGFAVAYEPLAEDIHAQEPQAFAAALNRAIENLVRRDPAQYQWEYKRFKRQPPGHPAVYAKPV